MRSPPKRRMSMSMVLPEGPVRRHRYQPPPTVHSYLNKMNEAVSEITFFSSVFFFRNCKKMRYLFLEICKICCFFFRKL